jgi:hypothetical protein
MNCLNVRMIALQDWLTRSKKGEPFVYHRGELARDKQHDPSLCELAERMLTICNGRFDVVSECGHIRGEIIGSGAVELVTRRDRGETVYFARKR